VGSNVTVSALPPDTIVPGGKASPTQLNLYMYMTTPNLGWSNTALPSRNSDGNRLSNPPLALDLHYLLTAYGSQDFQAEILLGCGMQLLHETPVLPRSRITMTLTAAGLVQAGTLPASLMALATSGLADQVEQIKITPQVLSVDEMSRLWTAFQSNYRPSAAYLVTVVLIESRRATSAPLPVRTSNIKVIPFQQPEIDSMQAASGPDSYIEANSAIIISGQRLKGDITRVTVSGQEISVSGDQLTDTSITLKLPGALSAGVQAVQVAHLVDFGTGSAVELHHGVESNVSAFILHPALTADSTTSGVTSRTVNGQTLRSGTLNLSVIPQVRQDQRIVLLLNPVALAAPATTYSFQGPPRTSPIPTSTLQIPFTDVIPGQYLVRVQVDGAESALQSGPDGAYNRPQVTI